MCRAAIIVGLLALIPLAHAAEPAEPPPDLRVLVTPFTILDGDAKYAWIGRAIQQNLQAELAREPQIEIVGTVSVQARLAPQQVATDEASIIAAAQAAKTDIVIFGSYQVIGRDLRITGKVFDLATNEALGFLKVTGSQSELLALEDKIVEQSRGILGLSPPAVAAESEAETAIYDPGAAAPGPIIYEPEPAIPEPAYVPIFGVYYPYYYFRFIGFEYCRPHPHRFPRHWDRDKDRDHDGNRDRDPKDDRGPRFRRDVTQPPPRRADVTPRRPEPTLPQPIAPPSKPPRNLTLVGPSPAPKPGREVNERPRVIRADTPSRPRESEVRREIPRVERDRPVSRIETPPRAEPRRDPTPPRNVERPSPPPRNTIETIHSKVGNDRSSDSRSEQHDRPLPGRPSRR